MDIQALDWGSVPDYFVLSGLFVVYRNWRKDRDQERSERERDREEEMLRRAQVTVGVLTPQKGRPFSCDVVSYAEPIFDVQLEVEYVGNIDVPDELRKHSKSWTLIPPGVSGTAHAHWDADQAWPEGFYADEDFHWSVTFTDISGIRWVRPPTGLPTRTVVPTAPPTP